MKKTKKLLSVTLVIFTVWVLFLFASCGSNNGDKKTVTPDGSGTAPTSGNEAGGTSEGEVPEFAPTGDKYNAYNFKIIGFDSYEGGWRAMTYCETYAAEINSDPINDALYNRNAKVEELYDIKITNVPLSYGDRDSHTRVAINHIMADPTAFDMGLMLVGSTTAIIRDNANIAFDLFEVDGLDLTKSWWDKSSVEQLSIGGRLYYATGDISLYNAFARSGFVFNKKILSDTGLENPYELVRSGKWTWDKLAEMARQATKDLDGDAVIDYRYDRMGLAIGHGSLGGTITSSGEMLAVKDADDYPVINNNQDKIVSIIDKIMPIMRDPTIACVAVDMTRYSNPCFEFIMPKFKDNELMFYQISLLNALELRDMDADFGILPQPKYDEAQDWYYSGVNGGFQTMVWIPAGNEDIDRTAAVIEAMGYYGQQYVIPAFYETTITHKALRDEDSLEMLDIIRESVIYDLGMLYGWGGYSGIFDTILSKKSFTNNFISSYDKISEKIQIDLDLTLEKLW